MTTQNLARLRAGNDIILFDRFEKLYVGFKLNKSEQIVCWKRLVSKDKRNWITWNKYLSLKEVDAIINELRNKTKRKNLSIVII